AALYGVAGDLNDQLSAMVGPAQAKRFTGRDDGGHCPLAADLIASQREVDRTADRDLDQEEILEAAGPHVDGWAYSQHIEAHALQAGAVDDAGDRDIRQPFETMRFQNRAQPGVHRLEIVRRELTARCQWEGHGGHGATFRAERSSSWHECGI